MWGCGGGQTEQNSVSSEFHGRPGGHGRPIVGRPTFSGRPEPGRKSGSGRRTARFPGKKKMGRSKLSDMVDGKGWGGWRKLDPHAATHIHGPNPTKSQLTNKSQKKIWGYFGGDFRI